MYVGLDVGGTNLKGARVSAEGACSFRVAELGGDAGAVGAARVAMLGPAAA